MNLNDPRLSFEFRVSKKIAELTQVVHMLFKKHHEKECELAALREAYEQEVQLVQRDAQERLEAQELLAKDREDAAARLDACLAQQRRDFEQHREALERQLADRDGQLARMRESRDQMKRLLEEAAREIDGLRSSVTVELSEKGERSRLVEEENAGLQEKLAKMSYRLADKERAMEELNKELDSAKKRAGKWNKECTTLQAYIEEQAKAAEALKQKNKQIENELRTLKRDMSRRLSDGFIQPPGSRNDRSVTAQPDRQLEEECERLQRELTKYKLELANRDLNLNRVFNDHSPIIVDLKAGRIAAQPQAMPPPTSRENARTFRSAGMAREKTFHYVVSQDYDDSPAQLRRQRTAILEASLRQSGRQQHQQQQQQQQQQHQQQAAASSVPVAAPPASGQFLRKPQPPRRSELIMLDKGGPM